MHHHGEALRRLGGAPETVRAFACGEAPTDLPERLRRLIAFAVKLTREGRGVREQDLLPLREAGLGDSGIHDAVAIAAYFNFVNRLALGLGVEIEES